MEAPAEAFPRRGQSVQHDGAHAREPGPDPGGHRVDVLDLAEAAAPGLVIGVILLLLPPALRRQRDAVLVEGDLALTPARRVLVPGRVPAIAPVRIPYGKLGRRGLQPGWVELPLPFLFRLAEEAQAGLQSRRQPRGIATLRHLFVGRADGGG
ncbi:hypothetical protein PG984_012206 [Apiospora sp. TS-2023a]